MPDKKPVTGAIEAVGIVAGWGSFPVEIAEKLRADGKEVYVVAIKEHADERLEQLATRIQWLGVLKIGAHLRFFSQMGVTQVALAGKLFKDRILYHGRGWIDHLPDFTCARILGSSFITKSRDACDDTVLNAIVNAYTLRGIDVMPITDIAPALLAEEGCLTKRRPTRSERLDIQFGWSIARSMGGLDIGQSITVRDQVILGVEAIEGTDALILRTGQLCPRGGFTLIKVAKPQQDMRFDVPTIGLRTVKNLYESGGRTIAIESGRTIMVQREETLDYANSRGLTIVAMKSEAAELADDNSAANGYGQGDKSSRRLPSTRRAA
jgi:DUF1009 family protein